MLVDSSVLAIPMIEAADATDATEADDVTDARTKCVEKVASTVVVVKDAAKMLITVTINTAPTRKSLVLST